ncbi:recombinase family protein [Agaribacillus aureus]|uniref:recombinase family protein n=1 Tax=Agaribacillus aureus TaxID=3051825 RepID=UPI003D242786
MVAHLREGDTVVVWKLDRLGQSLRHLVNLVGSFNEMGVDFVSINNHIDTTSSQGRLMFNIFASFAEFERELISERTEAGLANARRHGRRGGWKPGLSKQAKIKAWAALKRSRDFNVPISQIQQELGLSKATYYRYLQWTEEEERSNGKIIAKASK